MNLAVLLEQNIFLQECFKYLVFMQIKKKTLNILLAVFVIDLSKSNGVSEGNIEIITKADNNFAPIVFDCHVLPDINFYGHCL